MSKTTIKIAKGPETDTMISEEYDFLLKSDDEATFQKSITKWGRSWGFSLTRECALMNLSPGDIVEVTLKVVKRNPQ